MGWCGKYRPWIARAYKGHERDRGADHDYRRASAPSTGGTVADYIWLCDDYSREFLGYRAVLPFVVCGVVDVEIADTTTNIVLDEYDIDDFGLNDLEITLSSAAALYGLSEVE